MTESQKINEHNLATSPFLNLPSEVRNRIYELTLGGNIWEIDTEARAINLTPKADRNDHRDLLLVCRQIYGESRVLPWSLGSFKCVSEDRYIRRWIAKFRRWVAKFPPEFRRAITSIILVDEEAGDAPLKDELLKEWTTRSNLSLQDFPGLKRLQVQVRSPVSTEDPRKMVMMDANSKMDCLGWDDTQDRLKPCERIAGKVCVTWIHTKYA
ncbi:hypothetical protein J4E91_010674 [Alternaria rosae]|nr:hypothetical protein J4E91_010674 [Alternaria rosae]